MILRLFIFCFALVAAGGAAWMVTVMNAKQDAVEVVEQEIPTLDVLVAVTPIAGGEVISPERVRWQPWPETTLNEQYIRRDEQPEAVAELSGSFVNRAFGAGEPIRAERLMETNINLLSNKITAGKRAVAVKITAENTAGGFVLPGDRVDVIHTVTTVEGQGQPARNESQIIIRNARVLAIDQTAVQSPEGSVLGQTATLELSPEETERVVAAEASGLLALALRAITDHTETPEDQVVETDEIRTVRIHRGSETSSVTLR
ncbi:MAG: Flp pilus assembly protein CpaB [Pseudomonadota bacterium]